MLAYSTISALGVLMLLFGMGTPQAVAAGFVYLLAHACYKGALFLVAGAVEHETGTRDVASLGGLRAAMPVTAIGAALAAVRWPAFRCSRVHRQGAVLRQRPHGGASGIWSAVLVSLAVAASMCLGAAGLDRRRRAVSGPLAPSPAPHDAPPSLWLGPLDARCALGSSSAFCRRLPPALSPSPRNRSRDRSTLTLGLWHGFTITLAVECADARGFVGLVQFARSVVAASLARGAADRASLHVRAGGIGSLSRRVAPAMQSASLRSYALTVVVTAIALVSIALATGRSFPPPRRGRRSASTKRRLPHSSSPAALSATFARSSMAAALVARHRRVRRGADVRAARRTGSGDDPVRRRNPDGRHLRARLLPVARISAICRRGWSGLAMPSSRSRRGARHHLGVVHRRLRDNLAAGGLFRRGGAAAGATAATS